MKFTILGQGTAVPEHSIDRNESIDIVAGDSWRSEKERRILRALYRRTGVEKRHSVLLHKRSTEGDGPQYDPLFRQKSADDLGPSVGARMEVYEERAFPLALRAAASAIERSGLSGEDITHLITVSCSGFCAPGVDLKLVKFLSLPATVERAHIGFMGCQGALNGLRVARAFANADPAANVLLCAVELCSLHYHYGWDPEQVVANALFADGSAALVGTLCDANEGLEHLRHRRVPLSRFGGRDELADSRPRIRDEPLAQNAQAHRRTPARLDRILAGRPRPGAWGYPLVGRASRRAARSLIRGSRARSGEERAIHLARCSPGVREHVLTHHPVHPRPIAAREGSAAVRRAGIWSGPGGGSRAVRIIHAIKRGASKS